MPGWSGRRELWSWWKGESKIGSCSLDFAFALRVEHFSGVGVLMDIREVLAAAHDTQGTDRSVGISKCNERRQVDTKLDTG